MTIKTLNPEVKTHKPVRYDFAAVGIVVPEVTILHPSVAGHTDEMHVSESRHPGRSFSFTHDGVLTGMHRFANRYGILGVPKSETAVTDKNGIIGLAIQKMLQDGHGIGEAFHEIVPRLEGAFSVIAKDEDKGDLLVAVDRNGIGSMFIGELPSGGYAVSSQEQAVEEYAAPPVFEVEPGTIVRIGANAIYTTQWLFK